MNDHSDTTPISTNNAKDESVKPADINPVSVTSTTQSQQIDQQTNPLNIEKDISPEQVDELKAEAIEYAKQYSKTGTSTRKEPAPSLANNRGPYYWWENQSTFESNTWSVSFWEYDDNSWQLQATKVELNPDGKSRMTAYSMRKDTDPSFPGFQIYREQKDDRYHPAAIEDIVYLNRVLKSLVNSSDK